MLAGAVLGTLAYIGHPDAALLRRGVPVEAKGTGASSGVVVATADRVRTADVLALARIWKKGCWSLLGGTRKGFLQLQRDTLTLVVDAGLSSRAVLVAPTSQDARSTHARLLDLALTVSDARNHALAVHALLAGGTVGRGSTDSCNEQ